jgi:two-component system, LytTR family, sensor kinase
MPLARSGVLSVHEPLLVNLLGHAAGALIFAIFLALLWRDRPRTPVRNSRLSMLAAALALAWNLASLVVLILPRRGSALMEVLVVLAFSALSILPAVLLDLSSDGRLPRMVLAGYCLSAIAVLLHAAEPFVDQPQQHRFTLTATSLGFAILTLVSGVALLRSQVESRKSLASRLAASMALCLLSLSFAHFDSGAHSNWQLELLVHHASIPLALFVLLQDYRFVLLDAFVRFLANILLAGGFTWAAVVVARSAGWLGRPSWDPADAALALVSVSGLLIAFALVRGQAQRLLSRLVFGRTDLDAALDSLRRATASAASPTTCLEAATLQMAAYMGTEPTMMTAPPGVAPVRPALISDFGDRRMLANAEGVEVVVPLRLGSGEVRYLGLGRRFGGRRYLSEDLDALAEMSTLVESQLEQLREQELRQLVSEAELRALQSQIHPHFLFNALNTLYGVIPRQAAPARRMVLNLADIFRYFLRTDRTLIPLEEELRIVQAYLEIESLRLGDKLRVEVSTDPGAARIPIPVLSIQPLVENAVKHGIARQPHGGLVRIETKVDGGNLNVRVSDDGSGFAESPTPDDGSPGIGLENVRRRLRLCYGPDAHLEIVSGNGPTCVGFRVPVVRGAAVA